MEQPAMPTEPIPVTTAPVKTPYPISAEFQYPEKLSRLTTFFRIFMIIPHLIVLYLVGIVASVVIFIAWFAILFTGNYPRGLFNFAAGWLRWTNRVNGYSSLLTDKYPPFTLD